MDRKSIAIIAVVFVVAVAAICVAMEMDERKDNGKDIGLDADGYKLSLSLSLNDGLKCFIGEKEYFDGDTIVLYSDTAVTFVAPQLGTISCIGSWSDPYGTSGNLSASEYTTHMECDVSFAAYFGDMTGTLKATFHAGD